MTAAMRRDPQFAIANLVRGLASIDAATASAELAAANAERFDVAAPAPVPILAVLWVLRAVAGHEAAHAWHAIKQGWRVPRCILWPDGSGITHIEGGGNDYDSEVHRVVSLLVGVAHDLRAPYSDVSPCYDLRVARLHVDSLNARALGPHVTFEHVAAMAVAFVDEHIGAIENIGLVLFHTRELTHDDVALFGGSGYVG